MTEPKRAKPLANDTLCTPQIASLLALGKSNFEIAKQLHLGHATVKRIANKDECKAIVAEITTSYKETAKAVAAKAVAEMTELAVEGLKTALKEGNVQAIRTHFQVIGLIGQEEADASKKQGAQTLQIIMPGAHAEKPAVEVESEFSFEPPSTEEREPS